MIAAVFLGMLLGEKSLAILLAKPLEKVYNKLRGIKEKYYNERKQIQKTVAAATATGVILLVVLISVMIFQLIAINMENAKKKELDAAIAHYEQL